MEIFFLVNSWEKKVQRVCLTDLGKFQNPNVWVCGCECLRGISGVGAGINTPCTSVSR